MMRLSGILCFFLIGAVDAIDREIKVLHITFHEGCKNDFEDVAQELGLNLTSWFVQSLPPLFWEGFAAGNEIYNVSHRRAARIWNKHKEFFDQFDVIVTSDTVPLARIFLQHKWKKPLIIWVCNRFDYRHGNGGEDRFPDQEYYDLIKKATTMKNVRFISYTPYEWEYARRKKIELPQRTIKPLGKKERDLLPGQSLVPHDVDKKETVFIFPRLADHQMALALRECAHQGILAWSGVYNGPEDLKGFKGVVFFPYNFSNLALFENLQRGIIHFVPTQQFLMKLNFARVYNYRDINWCEWYFKIYRDYFVFFDSWRDLARKIKSTDFPAMREKIRAFGHAHRESMIKEWKTVFEEVASSKLLLS